VASLIATTFSGILVFGLLTDGSIRLRHYTAWGAGGALRGARPAWKSKRSRTRGATTALDRQQELLESGRTGLDLLLKKIDIDLTQITKM
jgi:hypothetical protein